MNKIKGIINNLSNAKRISCLIIVLIFFLMIIISIPSLAKLKNRSTLSLETEWNGEVATEYRGGNGTQQDPYIISNGGELAFFALQLKENDYENTYFKLSNDIVLNKGFFNYDTTEGVQYIENNTTYFVDEYTKNFYASSNREGNIIGQVNDFSALNNFKGTFDGQSFAIYGLYMTSSTENELGLFTQLKGNVSNLYVKNSIIYGGNITGGISSSTANSNINNVQYEGFVIGKNTEKIQNNNVSEKIMNTTQTETIETVSLTNTVTSGKIISTSLTGEYSLENPGNTTQITINGTVLTNNTFEIDLGSTLLNSVEIRAISLNGNNTINLSNLKYNVVYSDSITAGIVGNAKNTSFENVINKAQIFGNYISGGVLGSASGSGEVSQSYNTGNVYGNYIGGGVVSNLYNLSSNYSVSKCYNTGLINSVVSGGLLGNINSQTNKVNILSSFNASDNYSINNITNTEVNVTNSYNTNNLSVYSGYLENQFSTTTLEELKNKTFLSTTLGFNEFVSFNDLEDETSNVWMYESNEIPVLYIDDIKKPIATINLNSHTWNNFSTELNVVDLNSTITFNIEETSENSNIKSKSYFISKSRNPLAKEDLDLINNWEQYKDIVQITQSGYYVIYAKIIDNNNKVTYLNTDVLALDLTGVSTSISLDNKIWSKYKGSLDSIYINQSKTLTISATSDLLSFESIQYYITNLELTKAQLETISDWINYSGSIGISEPGEYIIYAKIVDSNNKTTYINTDYIIYGGYQENLSYGGGAIEYTSNYITSNSSINLNFTNETNLRFEEGYTHNIISSISLPPGTTMVLIDNKTNKVYKRIVTNKTEEKKYSFEQFEEIGTAGSPRMFDESRLYNTELSDEDYSIIIDLSETEISENYDNVTFSLEIENRDNETVFETLDVTVKSTNIYSKINNENTTAEIVLNTAFSGNPILYNSDSTTNLEINESLVYYQLNERPIIDTTYEDKKMGLSIKMEDASGNTVNKKYLKNMMFKIENNEYFAEEDNIVRINLLSESFNETKNLSIITKQNDNKLADGTYYLKISGYASYDGYYSGVQSSNQIIIPVQVTSSRPDIEYSFSVEMPKENRIINKKLENRTIAFNITESGDIINPRITISLYKKNQYTAYNQEYSVVDLKNYTTNSLEKTSDNEYLISSGTFTYNLNLNVSSLDNAGYKYVLKLYDGTKKIDTIEKTFIVK